ncbi:DUF948 domain-containing protein [Paenibacillus sediminis]|uniref:Uncharacterized protein YoxC n=1 Tax=Paenibacillus sediminis TaxID=664909 RepID=A0ABS4H5I4_9BACL|nr:DUF948 domain-containing protein [Paenibacillus sediminis]MBP1937785.1 uncharacterized protein YoxC [Paenibacillus sediminis]
MMEWSAAVVAASFVLLVAAVVYILYKLHNVLKQTNQAMIEIRQHAEVIAREAEVVLQQGKGVLSRMDRQIQTIEPVFISIQGASKQLQKMTSSVNGIAEFANKLTLNRVNQAHLENEQRFGEMFRWFDAGLTVWHSWCSHQSIHSRGNDQK